MSDGGSGKKTPPKTQGSAKPSSNSKSQVSPPAHGSMLDEAMATQIMRQSWTRERSTFLSRMYFCSMVLNVVLIAIIGILALRPVEHLYFWTNGDGTIRPLVALSEPVLSDAERSIWVTQAVVSAFTVDFTNYRAQLQSSRPNFTTEGHEAFLKALQSSGIQAAIIQYKYNLSAVPKAAPVQTSLGRLPDGRFAWQYELPIILTFQASDRSTSQEMTLQVVVVRVKETENPKGMAIARFQAR